eukprot:TRINITY_DN14279_c0_g1_i2.p1 TRINITY_DN14279_c0_g1~~TRINITY_DN14279_c0_g1_i2.p1  ORF type:complete len:155 (-),score=35.48 TRINITY_DN14279_c0_g1_i2:527-925(-)
MAIASSSAHGQVGQFTKDSETLSQASTASPCYSFTRTLSEISDFEMSKLGAVMGEEPSDADVQCFAEEEQLMYTGCDGQEDNMERFPATVSSVPWAVPSWEERLCYSEDGCQDGQEDRFPFVLSSVGWSVPL